MSARHRGCSAGGIKRTVKRSAQSGAATGSTVAGSVCMVPRDSTGRLLLSPRSKPLWRLTPLDGDKVLGGPFAAPTWPQWPAVSKSRHKSYCRESPAYKDGIWELDSRFACEAGSPWISGAAGSERRERYARDGVDVCETRLAGWAHPAQEAKVACPRSTEGRLRRLARPDSFRFLPNEGRPRPPRPTGQRGFLLIVGGACLSPPPAAWRQHLRLELSGPARRPQALPPGSLVRREPLWHDLAIKG